MTSARRSSSSQAGKLTQSFFQRPAAEVAEAYDWKNIGAALQGKLFRACLIETEAYLGPADLASHASKGRTRRTEVLFGAPSTPMST